MRCYCVNFWRVWTGMLRNHRAWQPAGSGRENTGEPALAFHVFLGNALVKLF